MFFNPNTTQETRQEIFSILGPMQDSRHIKYLGLLSYIWEIKEASVWCPKGESGSKVRRMERQTSFNGWKGDSHQSHCPRNPYIHNELFSTPTRLMWGHGKYDEKFLVGTEAKRIRDNLNQLEKNVQTKS